MKKLFSILLFVALTAPLFGQATQGTLTYVRTVAIKRDMSPEMEARMGSMPEEMESEFELLFKGSESLYRAALLPDDMDGGPGWMRFMRYTADGGLEVYSNISEKQTTTLYELGQDQYVVSQAIEPQGWKLTNETKEILGYTCRKAMTDKVIKKMSFEVVDGKRERTFVDDTVKVEAWYTEQIPTPGGPEFQGTLPGMIMELDIDEGRVHYLASHYRKGYEKRALKAAEGEEITKEEFEEKRKEFFESFRGMRGGHRH